MGSFPRAAPHPSLHVFLAMTGSKILPWGRGGPQSSPELDSGAAVWEHLTQCCSHHFYPGFGFSSSQGQSTGRGQEGAVVRDMAGCAETMGGSFISCSFNSFEMLLKTPPSVFLLRQPGTQLDSPLNLLRKRGCTHPLKAHSSVEAPSFQGTAWPSSL